MKNPSLRHGLFLLIGMLLFTGGYIFGQSGLAPVQLLENVGSTPRAAEKAFQPFWETWELIHEEYFDQPLDDELLAEGAIEGMLATLDDPNTRYLSPDEEVSARQALDGNIEGIGVEVTSQEGDLVIVAPYEGSPAAAAGLREGDILRKADGVVLTGLDISEAASYVRGPAGTTVNLLVERDGDFFEVAVERGVISVSAVRGEIIDERFAYVRVSRFNANAGRDLRELLERLSESEPQGLILDLRSNPGGSLSSAVDIADQFLSEGVILLERFGNGQDKLYESDDGGLAEELPLVVLINEGSASASEVLAGAISDHGRGILIGSTSFGKGTVQTWQSLSNGGGVRITIARWLTPDGAWVHGEGLAPDIQVTLSETGDGEADDTQLQAAISYLTEQSLNELQAETTKP